MISLSFNDIFSDLDNSIIADGSQDPMGLRIIWTSIGGKIFGNKLNTISTDIRLYTINLFHHHLIRTYEQNHEDKISNLVGSGIYHSKQDVRDGLIIFLECLMTLSVRSAKDLDIAEGITTVLGMVKLGRIIANNPNDTRLRFIELNRSKGILSRQYALGVHGRHKGPFVEMGLLNPHDYYLDQQLWNRVNTLFQTEQRWKNLQDVLLPVLDRLISQRLPKSGSLSLPVKDTITEDLVIRYVDCLQPEVYCKPSTIRFWEESLGLHEGAAGNLYQSLKQLRDKQCAYQEVINLALKSWSGNEKEYVEAIIAVEPFLTFIDKVSRRMLLRGTTSADCPELIAFAQQWFSKTTFSIQAIEPYLTNNYFDAESLSRLKKLISIYQQFAASDDYTGFFRALIDYHKALMDRRGNVPWLSVSSKNELTHNRPLIYNKELAEELQKPTWVNNYYLSTLNSLYNGLHYTHETV
jgi:hypothetical protein